MQLLGKVVLVEEVVGVWRLITLVVEANHGKYITQTVNEIFEAEGNDPELIVDAMVKSLTSQEFQDALNTQRRRQGRRQIK